MKVLIGTKNPGKIQGAKEALENYFENFDIEGISVSSNVGEEPVNNEIYEGARNRVDNLIKYAEDNNIDAEYFLGVESGITNLLGKWIIVNIAVIKDKNGYESWGTSPAFPVPDRYVEEIISTDLGKVMDKIFQEKDLNKVFEQKAREINLKNKVEEEGGKMRILTETEKELLKILILNLENKNSYTCTITYDVLPEYISPQLKDLLLT